MNIYEVINTHFKRNFLIECVGSHTYFDLGLAELLEGKKFLVEVLKIFLCFFIQKKFKLKKEFPSYYNKKIWEYVIETINYYHVLDIALIVFFRSYLIYDIKCDIKNQIKPEKFGIEPSVDDLKIIFKTNNLSFNLINIDTKTIFSKNLGKEFVEINLCYYQESYNLLFTEKIANKMCDYDNVKKKSEYAFKIYFLLDFFFFLSKKLNFVIIF